METKKQFKYFTIVNHEKEEAYLRSMHKSGWRFVKVTGLGVYHFEKCEPCDVVYQLDYNQEGSKNKEEYIKMFFDCGWEFIQEYVGYSYFRKPASEMRGEEGIFNDESSRSAMMERVYVGRVLPLVGIFCACLLPQFIMNTINGNYGISILMGSIIAIYIVVFAILAISFYRKKK